ncbi:Villin-2 [Olea europaea subsp. europaea]|uniref:Villin-2 n=1 Tax=Olea europaea subsp. europaea TaxID=158383 RepID=A0A8S0RUH0_OLEEU|nr:Villin-2 [Olea europaea subsp. europaea]
MLTLPYELAGKFEVEEIYNFCQDDLLTEDILILDTHAEVCVWIGQSVDLKDKQNSFEIGQKYVDMAASLEGLSPKVTLYKVTEGNEPCFFTTYFSWDPAKAIAHGNSFQKKVMLLFGAGHSAEEKSHGSNHEGPTQRASALAALNSAFSSTSASKRTSATRPGGINQGSQRAAAVAALSNVLTAEKKRSPDSSPAQLPAGIKSEDASEGEYSKEALEVMETGAVESIPENNGDDSGSKPESSPDENGTETAPSIFTYDQLKAKSHNPVMGIDFKRREAYLSDEDFLTVMGMVKDEFYKLPKWKQDIHKKKVDLF